MRLPDLLATRRGRLAAFFCLYITEGIPLGFAATAVARERRAPSIEPMPKAPTASSTTTK